MRPRTPRFLQALVALGVIVVFAVGATQLGSTSADDRDAEDAASSGDPQRRLLPAGELPREGAADTSPGSGGTAATFAAEPETLAELVDAAPAAVEAVVVAIEAGDTVYPDDVPRHPNGDGELPTQRITFRVDDTWYGSTPEEFTIEKLGSATLFVEGDPPYKVGERYVLFVERAVEPVEGTRASSARRRSTGPLYARVARSGRLRVDKEGKLEAFVGGPLTEKLKGRPKQDVREETEDERRR
jgi:hypothetical protein